MADFEKHPEDIEEDFPNAQREGYDIKSELDVNYNCLAFAVGDVIQWWDIDPNCGHFWPPGFPRETSVSVIIKILNLHGFTVPVSEGELTTTVDAAAIFGSGDGQYTHVAKWNSGTWMSKLGWGHDIHHKTLRALESEIYGSIVAILARETKPHTS